MLRENLLEDRLYKPKILFQAIGVLFKEICGNHDRDFWYTNTEDARKLGIDENSPICDPFKEELNPNAETLARLAALLNELIHNKTRDEIQNQKANLEGSMNGTETEEVTSSASTLLKDVMDSGVTETPDEG